MNVLKWVYSAIFVSVIIVLIGVVGQGKLFVSQATADDVERPVHADIAHVEKSVLLAYFDMSRKNHLNSSGGVVRRLAGVVVGL